MFHYFFLVMTLSGSLVFLLYKLTEPIFRRWFPPFWRKGVLYLSLFFYLFPLPLLKDRLFKRLGLIQFRTRRFEGMDNYVYDPQYAINIGDGGFLPGPGAVAVVVFAVCTAVIASVIVIRQLRRYRRTYRAYQLKAFCGSVPPSLGDSLQATKEELKLKRPVKLVCSKLCDSPVTIGVLSPTIVFPASGGMELEADDRRSVLKHELLHVKHRDLLVKFLALLALAIHWYDPVCYLLFRELRIVSELDCDYGVTKDYTDPQRRRYGELILDLATAGDGRKERFSLGLVDNGAADFKRRLLEMKKTRKSGRPLLACAIIALIGAAGVAAALAYESPLWVNTKNDWREYEAVFFLEYDAGMEHYFNHHFPYDEFFTDPDGEIFPLEDIWPDSACGHDLLEGTATRHTKNDDGGCTVAIDSALFCPRCGYAAEEKELSTEMFLVCMHP